MDAVLRDIEYCYLLRVQKRIWEQMDRRSGGYFCPHAYQDEMEEYDRIDKEDDFWYAEAIEWFGDVDECIHANL